ncbi:hypothetical protein BDU57DRAFT_524843 [Ampelomyces quisqualis]|uniref:MOSC N-terminal beta barrel domain-containing protein n=1 Tax=Ampelomyces quisqualis TaxID=50730 RepID=A0A6A5Q6F9_AMPQU|nr:hypothetical protein BDU57DRAFT_524843 [Ampelomyces quisqualis]
MAPVPNNTQLAIIASAFFVPVLIYLYFTRAQTKKGNAGPLPESTEITALYVYPIKSCHGISVQSTKHEFLTIRNFAKMTLVRPTYDALTDTLTITAPAPDSIDEKLEFTIPAHPSKQWLDSNTSTHDAKIWSTWTPARVYSPSLTAPFNAFFDKQVRLVYKASLPDPPRPLVSNGAPNILWRSATTHFPDLMPLLVGNESSLTELNTRMHGAGDKARHGRAALPAEHARQRKRGCAL